MLQKKIPGPILLDPGIPDFPSDITRLILSSGTTLKDAVTTEYLPKASHYSQAGLLTSGSSYLQRLPIRFLPREFLFFIETRRITESGFMLLSSPVTAAGPSPIFTEFPIKLLPAPEKLCRI